MVGFQFADLSDDVRATIDAFIGGSTAPAGPEES
jgi:hypothetical protein